MDTDNISLPPEFDLENMDDDEAHAFADEVGKIVIESTLTRFVAEANPEEVLLFEQTIAATEDLADAMPKLATEVPRFIAILNEEMAALRTEAGGL